MLRDWRSLKVGEKLRWYGTEFDGSWDVPCVVSEVYEDHAIADMDGSSLYIDDDFADMFRRENLRGRQSS